MALKIGWMYSLHIANYLSRCYAFNRGRNVVSVEDIADAWILTLKLFLNDLRPYIRGLESNSPCASLPSVNSYKNIKLTMIMVRLM